MLLTSFMPAKPTLSMGIFQKRLYLDIDKIIGIAKKAHCDAIHPGYGFLSENPDFAEATVSHGMTFVGPPASAMMSMGGKTSARDLIKNAKVPIMPGTTFALSGYQEALKVAKEIGYPVLLKAVHGGGGKGMRRVDREENSNRLCNRRNQNPKKLLEALMFLLKNTCQIPGILKFKSLQTSMET